MKLKIGQTVFLKPVNNRARYGNNEIAETTVRKIGRKYFYVGDSENERSWDKFLIDDLSQVTEYSTDWELYLSKQDISDKEEADRLFRDIRDKFEFWNRRNYTLDQLKRIKMIVDETE